MAKPSDVQIDPEILAAVAILNRGAESIRAVMAGEENRFSRALEDLQRLAEAEGIPIAIVGGLGAIRYGYPAATQDIDVVVAREHLDRLVQVAPRYGFKVAWEARSGWHTLTHGDVEIKVVPEGGKARTTAPTTIPGPVQLGVAQGLGYARLPGWMELKLSSGRQKDLAHVVEVMKKTSTEALQEVRDHLATVHSSYLDLFDRLSQQAQEEGEQENQREE
jgi:hypothetical protein